ncbi:DNA topology modulation protein [Streptococcus sp. DD13]|uniref:DNA topology modulation protein n=1 Tax=Streptococcus sp. DD13 TaxID=1777881 RepID=UPI00079C9143|nr:DNA topology modulation protein [Streptococcus sp. DD13]KXT78699.1 DNA topology modulation protein, flar-related protein [Streptococcus sp. DD13]
MKIMIIGYSGSGKSTLAEKLSRYYSIPRLHMDTLQFQPGWQESDRTWMQAEMKHFLTDHSDWVIDGNYSWCCYEERMEQADQIIFLNFSRWNCFFRAWKRYRRYKGRVRESMAAGCPERFDWAFIRWIFWDGRQEKQKTWYQSIAKNYPDKFISIKNQKELDAFLENNKGV